MVVSSDFWSSSAKLLKAMDAMVTHRSMKERRMREAARTWRKEGVNWKDEENEAWIYLIPSMEMLYLPT